MKDSPRTLPTSTWGTCLSSSPPPCANPDASSSNFLVDFSAGVPQTLTWRAYWRQCPWRHSRGSAPPLQTYCPLLHTESCSNCTIFFFSFFFQNETCQVCYWLAGHRPTLSFIGNFTLFPLSVSPEIEFVWTFLFHFYQLFKYMQSESIEYFRGNLVTA